MMQGLSKIKISTKLLGGFIIIAILNALMSFVAIYSLQNMGNDRNALYEVHRLSILNVEMLMIDFQKDRTLTRDIVLESRIGNFDKLSIEMETSRKASLNRMLEIEKNLDATESKNTIREIKDSFEKYYAYQDKILELKKQGKTDEALKMLQSEERMVSNGTLTLTENFYKTLLESGKLLNTHMDKNIHGTTIFLLVMSSLILVFSVFFGLGLSKNMSASLQSISRRLSESFHFIVYASGHLEYSSQNLAQSSSEQAASIEETSATMEQTSSMVKMNTENTRQAAILADQAKKATNIGSEQMHNMSRSMEEIKKSSDNIAKIIKVIDEIAFQTNILALNAAVEAARAGEAGLGFAVVAEEVRNLAQRSAKAAKDTTEIIEKNIELSKEGVDISLAVNRSLREINEKVDKVSQLVAEIAAASEEQARGVLQIAGAIHHMEQETQHNAAASEESSATAMDLKKQADELLSIVDYLDQFIQGKHVPLTDDKPKKMMDPIATHPTQAAYPKYHSHGGPKTKTIILNQGGRASYKASKNPNEIIPMADDTDF